LESVLETMAGSLPISVVIPTYRREQVLLDTLAYLLALDSPPAEILVLDQTERHEPATEQRLGEMDAAGRIRWLRLDVPSIPQAMNRGLLEARNDIVLFLDDDIRPEPELLAAHQAAHAQHDDVLVAGRVIQPWEEGRDFSADGHFHFAGLKAFWIEEFMGGNFSVRRESALALGGFDENFVRVAYRFEAEFAHRWRASKRRIRFEPVACLHHLKDGGGGTRTYGEHLTTWKPDHAVGAYYYALRTRPGVGWLRDFAVRPARAVATRYHLRHPWRIPATLLAELRGMLWAVRLVRGGPRYAKNTRDMRHA
jgi:glycosyltransferase involved in cell wall biosynthesis